MDERDLVLGNVLRALGMLEHAAEFSLLIPEVRSNLVFAVRGAKMIDDVAAVDGRITVVNGLPRAAGLPRFGASSHMARLILEVMKTDPEIRAGINFIHNDEFGEWLKKYCSDNRLALGCIDRSHEPEEAKRQERGSMPWKVRALISSMGKVPDIGYETGAVGKEPVSVLLGRTAVAVVEKIVMLGVSYVKSGKD